MRFRPLECENAFSSDLATYSSVGTYCADPKNMADEVQQIGLSYCYSLTRRVYDYKRITANGRIRVLGANCVNLAVFVPLTERSVRQASC